MDAELIKTAVEVICDYLDNARMSRNTRYNSKSSNSESKDFPYKNEDGSKFYAHKQYRNTFAFDTSDLRKLDPINAFERLMRVEINQLIIIKQRLRSTLDSTAFEKIFSKETITINVADATKTRARVASVDSIRKQSSKLSADQRRELILQEIKSLGYESIEEFYSEID